MIEDPVGATFGLWQPGARAGAQRVMEPSAWAMSALRTRDLRRAAEFYATVSVPPFDMAVFRRAVIADPAGAIFTISQLVPERLGVSSA